MACTLFSLTVVRLLLCLLPVGGANGQDRPTWTILIYGHADHNLSPVLVVDMLEMQKAGSSDQFRIVVQSDFDSNDNTTVKEGLPREFLKGTTRWLITKSDEPTINSTAVERLPEMNSDIPERISDFIAWGMRTYPADRYGVVLWNHGGSIRGYGGDTQDRERKRPRGVTVGESAEAVRSGMLRGGASKKLDFFGFDACLMANLETLASFADLAEVMIACGELDFGPGWDYDATLNHLKSDPGMSMRAFGIAEVEDYFQHHPDTHLDEELFRAHGAFDLSAVPAFSETARRLGKALSQNYTSEVARARRRAIEFDLSGDTVIPFRQSTRFADLPHFARNLVRSRKVDQKIRRHARNLLSAHEDILIAGTTGVEKKGAGIVNVFYPVNGAKRSKLKILKQIPGSRSVHWARVLIAARKASLRSQEPKIQLPNPNAIVNSHFSDVTVPFVIDVTSKGIEGISVSQQPAEPGNYLNFLIPENVYGRLGDVQIQEITLE